MASPHSFRREALLVEGDYPPFCAVQLAEADADDLAHRRRCRAAGRHELHAMVLSR